MAEAVNIAFNVGYIPQPKVYSWWTDSPSEWQLDSISRIVAIAFQGSALLIVLTLMVMFAAGIGSEPRQEKTEVDPVAWAAGYDFGEIDMPPLALATPLEMQDQVDPPMGDGGFDDQAQASDPSQQQAAGGDQGNANQGYNQRASQAAYAAQGQRATQAGHAALPAPMDEEEHFDGGEMTDMETDRESHEGDGTTKKKPKKKAKAGAKKKKTAKKKARATQVQAE
ncbi:unnamed protein product [Amoebophrya sp. A25]|nr:unnamed protein product [Amoebophrya sp. A25]|eukprot:GSA25T00016886001.1